MQTEKFLVKILKASLYMVAFVPLIIFSQYNSPFHFGKVIIFRSIVEIMLVVYILLIWQNRSYLPRFNKITWGFLAFALAFTLATITSVHAYQSFWGTLERMGGLWTFWHYFIYFIILTSIFRERKDWIFLFKLMAGAGILSALYGFGQKTSSDFFVGGQGRVRIFGTVGNAALFAGYQLLITFLSLTMFVRKEISMREKQLFGSAIILCGIAVMMTAVRGSILALGAGILLYAGLYAWTSNSKMAKKVLLSLISTFFVFIVLAVLLRGSGVIKTGYLERITNFSPNNFTVKTRFWTWAAGINGWNDSLKTIIIGWGPENFNIPFSKHFNPNFYTGPGSETMFDRAHNMFVEVLVTMGLIGLLGYLSIFWFSLRKLWTKLKTETEDRPVIIGLISIFVAYIIHNCFIFDTSANFITFFSILGFVSLVGNTDIESIRNYKKPNKIIFGFIAIVLSISTLILIYKTNVIPTYANYANTRGIIAGWGVQNTSLTSINDKTRIQKYFDEAIKKFKESIAYGVPGKYEYRNKIAQFILDTIPRASYIDGYEEALGYTIGEVQKNVEDFPQDYLPELYLSRLYITLGKSDAKSPYNDQALAHSLRALEISPTFVRTYYEVGQAYLNKKDYLKAQEYFAKAVELNPNVGTSLWYLASVKYQLSDKEGAADLAEKALKLGFSISESDYLRIVQIFLDVKNNDRVAWAIEELTKISPDNAQYWASAAVAYSRIGQIDKAIESAKTATRIDPKFEAEARIFVQSLGRQW